MTCTDDHKQEIGLAASIATRAIAEAAQSAVKAVTEAAQSASILVIHNAEETAKTLGAQRGTDHDAIVRISEKIDSLKEDVRDLKDGTAKRIDNLERDKQNLKDSYSILYKKEMDDFKNEMYTRIKTLEEGYAKMQMLGLAGVVFLGILQFVIDKFIK